MPAMHHAVGPALPNERAAINLLKKALPSDYVLITNVEISAGGAGRTHEHDVIVIAPWAIFAVELKAYTGLTTGNRDRWELEGGTIVQSPVTLQNAKARVLKGLLQRRFHALRGAWVQPLVFLTARDARADLTKGYDYGVCTRADIIQALTHQHLWPRAEPLTLRQREDAFSVIMDLGQKPSLQNTLGQFKDLEQLPDRAGARYEVLRGTLHGQARTLHVYPVRGGDEKTRERSRDYARREANLHERLLGGPGLLRYRELHHVTAPEEKLVLSFEDITPLLPLPDWIERYRPGVAPRLRVAQRIAEALRFVHSKEIAHRRLTLDAVLVPNQAAPDEVRLYAFELARDLSRHLKSVSADLLGDLDHRHTAVEVLRGGEHTRLSDRFALGTVLYSLLTDGVAFENAADILGGREIPSATLAGQPLPVDVELTLVCLMDADPLARPELDEVIEKLVRAQVAAPPPERAPLAAGDRVCRVYELESQLGEGASASVWSVRHVSDGQPLVAKIAHDQAASDALVRESEVLRTVEHRHLVRYHSREAHDGLTVVLLRRVDGHDGRDWAILADPLDLPATMALGEALFGALGALHTAGWVHRDVKPENLILTEPDAQLTLIDLGLAAPVGTQDHLTAGTAAYKDPALYREKAWGPRDDLFAAWITLIEVLTNVHPFAGTPGSGEPPNVDLEGLAQGLGDEAAARLAKAAQAALDPDPAKRPQDAAAATKAWSEALRPPQAAPSQLQIDAARGPAAPPPVNLPDDLDANTAIDAFDLSLRAHRALNTLGLTTAAQLSRVDPALLRGVPNVGRKTIAQILAYAQAIAAALGHERPAPSAPPPPPPGLWPSLVGSTAPLTELGPALTRKLHAHLRREGVLTVGDLAGLSEAKLRAWQGVGPTRVAKVKKALQRLAGAVEQPATLDELDERLRAALKSQYTAIAAVFGLRDGEPRNRVQAAELLGVTHQAVSNHLALDGLRAGGSPARPLVDAVRRLIGPVGFAPVALTAARLEAALPVSGALSPVGYVRLAAALLDPQGKGTRVEDIEWVVEPPWTPALIETLCEALSHAANWPPLPAAQAEALLWERAVEVVDHLKARQVTPARLLAATLQICDDVRRTPDGALFTPPVEFADALAALPEPDRLGPVEAVRDRLNRTFAAVRDPDDMQAAAEAAGLSVLDGRFVAADRAEPDPTPTVVVDEPIRTQRLVPEHGLDVEGLVHAAQTGGFRVVGLPLARHHELSETLAQALTEHLGDRVRHLDVDRIILDALRADPALWRDALAEERGAHPDYSWLVDEVRPALEHAVLTQATRGTVTVLGRPTLLGPLGLMDWLGGVYENARGGRHGLLVLAVPGGVHDDRVRLNERYSLTYTPDMAAVVYQEAADAR